MLTAVIVMVQTVSYKHFYLGFRCLFYSLYDVGNRITMVSLSALMLEYFVLNRTYSLKCTKGISIRKKNAII